MEPGFADLQAEAAPATVRSEMRIFLSMVEKHYGKKPIIYTSVDFFDDNGLSGVPRLSLLAALGRRPPATANMRATPSPSGNTPERASSRGISGDADINVFNGDMSAWRKWLKANTG